MHLNHSLFTLILIIKDIVVVVFLMFKFMGLLLKLFPLCFILETVDTQQKATITKIMSLFCFVNHRSDHPFLNPNISPGINPKAATGKPAASIVVECAANCDAVLFNA